MKISFWLGLIILGASVAIYALGGCCPNVASLPGPPVFDCRDGIVVPKIEDTCWGFTTVGGLTCQKCVVGIGCRYKPTNTFCVPDCLDKACAAR